MPTVTGADLVFQTLSADPGTWVPQNSLRFEYEWLRCEPGDGGCSSSGRGTSATHLLERDDYGYLVKAVVFASDGVQEGRAESQAVGPIRSANCGNSIFTGNFGTVASVPLARVWNSPDDARTQDGGRAFIDLGEAELSDALEFSGWGLSLPPNSVVTGYELTLVHSASPAGQVLESLVEFRSGNRRSPNIASGVPWVANLTTSVRSAPDTRILSSWSVDEINSPDFRVHVVVFNAGRNPARAEIDAVSLRLFYSTVLVVGPLYGSNAISSTWQGSWTNLPGALRPDGGYASATIMANQWSPRLDIVGFPVPAGINPSGILVAVHRFRTNGTVTDASIKLLKGGTPVGDDLADFETRWPAVPGVARYGSLVDRWGEPWADEDLRDGGFGVALFAYTPSPPAQAEVDAVEVFIGHSETQTQLNLVPAQAASVSRSRPWMNPGQALVRDGVNATVQLSSDQMTDLLRTSGHQIAVPSNAFVQAIVARVYHQVSPARTGIARFVSGGQVISRNQYSHQYWGAFEAGYGTFDRAILPSEVNRSDFGFEIAGYATATGTASIDGIEVYVGYCPHP